MSGSTQMLLEDATYSLQRIVTCDSVLSPSDRAFVRWILPDSPTPCLREMADEAEDKFNAAGSRSHHEIAVLGFAVDSSPNEPISTVLGDGLSWLCGRNYVIAGEFAPFFADTVALLGITLAARRLGGSHKHQVAEWIKRFAPKAARLPALEAWQLAVLSVALRVLNFDDVALLNDPSVADVRTAMRAKLLLGCGAEEAEQDKSLTIRSLCRGDVPSPSPVRAAIRLASLAWIRRAIPTTVLDLDRNSTVEGVVAILKRVPAGLRRWCWEEKARTRNGEARKWHIDNEYQVQDALYYLLAPMYPDLKDEENLPSIAQRKPRADLFLPSLRLVVEVKFLRQRDAFTKIVEEMAADASLYLANDRKYVGIVAFVWDDSRRTEEHPKLIEGLNRIAGILATVVVPRPGRM